MNGRALIYGTIAIDTLITPGGPGEGAPLLAAGPRYAIVKHGSHGSTLSSQSPEPPVYKAKKSTETPLSTTQSLTKGAYPCYK